MREDTVLNEDTGYAIEVSHITKAFRMYYDRGNTLKERALFSSRRRYENRQVLKDVSFTVSRGEAIGIIGQNGCGKSTTLKLLTRIMYPDSGTIQMSGRVSSLIELGAGFHPDMSGRENIYINASIFGLSRREIDERLDEIVEFSELEEFIDNPVRTYSSGMYMRLAFSVAINVNADILLVDEILAVGDAHFQGKCFEKMKEIKASGTTIVIVSHSLGQIEEICDRPKWIHERLGKEEGSPAEVHDKYLEYMGIKKHIEDSDTIKEKQQEDVAEAKLRYSNAKITSMEVAEAEGKDDTGAAGKLLRLGYELGDDGKERVFEVIQEGDHIRCRGNDILFGEDGIREMVMTDGEYLMAQMRLLNPASNLIAQMHINDKCDRNDTQICLHPDGVMYGPYIKAIPAAYTLIIDIDTVITDPILCRLTSDYGERELELIYLQNGRNEVSVKLLQIEEHLEFVLHNQTGADIVVNQLVFT